MAERRRLSQPAWTTWSGRSGEPGSLLPMIGLSAVFMLVTFVVFTAYGLFAAAVRDQALSRPRVMMWLRRVFAGSFIALGAKLAVAAR